MTEPDLSRHVADSDRSAQLTREYYGAAPAAELSSLEDIGFSMIALLTSLLVGAIALS